MTPSETSADSAAIDDVSGHAKLPSEPRIGAIHRVPRTSSRSPQRSDEAPPSETRRPSRAPRCWPARRGGRSGRSDVVGLRRSRNRAERPPAPVLTARLMSWSSLPPPADGRDGSRPAQLMSRRCSVSAVHGQPGHMVLDLEPIPAGRRSLQPEPFLRSRLIAHAICWTGPGSRRRPNMPPMPCTSWCARPGPRGTKASPRAGGPPPVCVHPVTAGVGVTAGRPVVVQLGSEPPSPGSAARMNCTVLITPPAETQVLQALAAGTCS